MSMHRHGLSVGIERAGDVFFLTLKVHGKLTHEDYETITPMLDAALEGVRNPRVKALIDATELEGWAPRAAWDDLELGLEHGNEFEKIAIHGNRKWQEFLSRIGGWFISGEVRYFDREAEAVAWLTE